MIATSRMTRAFTLIELLVVIAIIGILSAVVLASLGAARERAIDAAVRTTLKNMGAEIELLYESSGNYSFVLSCTSTSSPLQKFVSELQARDITVGCRSYNFPTNQDVFLRWGVSARSNGSEFKAWSASPEGVATWESIDLTGPAAQEWSVAANNCMQTAKRLPTLEEIWSLRQSYPSQAAAEAYFVSSDYWSLTEHPQDSSKAYSIGIHHGGVNSNNLKTVTRRVRCVR